MLFNRKKIKPKPITKVIEKKQEKKCFEYLILSDSLEVNTKTIKELFKDDETLRVRNIENQINSDIKCCIYYTDGLVSNQQINDNIVRPIQIYEFPSTNNLIDVLMNQIIQINEIKKTTDFEDIIQAIVYGDTVLVTEGYAQAIILNTKSFTLRSVAEPENEKILRGPREGFTEGLLTNLSMVRRRIRTEDLKMHFKAFGQRTKTQACILYVDGLVNTKILEELFRRLDKINIDDALDVNTLIELIKDAPKSPFKTIGEVEKPDIVAAKLLEGRIALVLDGTPVVMTLPYLFIENFQNAEDYYVNYYYSTFTRLLRIAAFFITISVPAFYIAMVNFHHEMIPTPLLLSISMARKGVPFPTVVEAFGMIVIFQILAETGIRMPTGIGQALSIVGALVIGQAAVEAKIVSAPMIIVISITGITGLIIPRLSSATLLIRFILLLFASFLGLYGFMFGMLGILLHLLNIRSFGVPYITDYNTLEFQQIKDIYIRAPWWKMITRPDYISKDKIRIKADGENK